MKKLLQLLCTVVLVLSSTWIYAQPANDDCANAAVVTEGNNQPFTTLMATTDGAAHANDCMSDGATPDSTYLDVWYSYTASFTGDAEWSFCGLADFDTKIFVYDGTASCPPGDDDIVGCSEDASGCANATSAVVFPVTMGSTYILRVGGYGDGGPGESGTGAFNLGEYVPPVGPDNDNCADAQVITLGMDIPCSNVTANLDGPEHPNNPCFGFGDNTVQADVWYSYTANFTGTVLWSTCNSVTFDSRLAVYPANAGSGCPFEDADLYACNDDGGGCMGYSSELYFDVENGATYLLRLGGYNAEEGDGTMNLIEIVPPEPPMNDLCTEPESVFVMTQEEADDFVYTFPGLTIASSIDNDAFLFPKCFTPTSGEFGDVWYTFDPEGRTEIGVRFSSSTEGASYYFDIWEDCDSLGYAPIMDDCFYFDGDDGSTFFEDTITNIPESHGQYYLRISTAYTYDAPGEYFFQLFGEEIVSVKELALESINFYPNPVSDIALLEFDLPKSDDIQIEINDLLGQSIYLQDRGTVMSGRQNMTFDLSNFQSGIYILSVRSGDRVKSMKFIKE